MKPNGTIRTLPASAAGYCRDEFQLQRQNPQRKMQFASALANKWREDGDETRVQCDKKAVMRKFLSSLDTSKHRHHRQRQSVSATAIRATTAALENSRAIAKNLRPETARPSSSNSVSTPLFSDERQCQDEEEREAPPPPANVSASSRDDDPVYEGDYYSSSSDNSSTEGGGGGLELSLQVDPDDDDDYEEQQLPCAQVSFDKSAETRDDDELSILSSSDQVDPFELAIFEHVCDPFPDDQVDIDFLSHP